MKKNLKYVKIEGRLKSRGEYDSSIAEHRPYEAVTIIDNEGDEIHFHTLQISKRMDESLNFHNHMSFYILRYRRKEKMFGVLYAVECNGNKVYYPDTAIPILKSFALQSRNRYHFIREPVTAIGFIISGGGALSLALGFGIGIDLVPAATFGFGGMALYMHYPLIFKSKCAGISKMVDILNSAGFNTNSNTNSKY